MRRTNVFEHRFRKSARTFLYYKIGIKMRLTKVPIPRLFFLIANTAHVSHAPCT